MNPAKIRPVAFAIVTDLSRRGRVRVCRVEIEKIYDALQAAAVEEATLRGLVPHVLGFERLARQRGDIAKKLRAYVKNSRDSRPAEEPALTAKPGAGRPTRVRPLWFRRDLEEPVSSGEPAAISS